MCPRLRVSRVQADHMPPLGNCIAGEFSIELCRTETTLKCIKPAQDPPCPKIIGINLRCERCQFDCLVRVTRLDVHRKLGECRVTLGQRRIQLDRLLKCRACESCILLPCGPRAHPLTAPEGISLTFK